METNCTTRREMSDACKLHLSELTIDINQSLQDGFKSISDRLLSLEISVANQSKDVADLKHSVNGLIHGNGVIGHKELVKAFNAHISSHEKKEDRLFQVLLTYGGKACIILINLFLLYKVSTFQDFKDNFNTMASAQEQKSE